MIKVKLTGPRGCVEASDSNEYPGRLRLALRACVNAYKKLPAVDRRGDEVGKK